MNKLRQFYLDESTREEVRDFMIKYLENMTVQRVFNGQSVVGILEARDVVNGSFSKLEEMFKIVKEKPVDNND